MPADSTRKCERHDGPPKAAADKRRTTRERVTTIPHEADAVDAVFAHAGRPILNGFVF